MPLAGNPSSSLLTAKSDGATSSLLDKRLKPMTIQRNAPAGNELLIDIRYCGVCHSDLHQVKNDWGNTLYPCVPGHDISGSLIGGIAETQEALDFCARHPGRSAADSHPGHQPGL